MKVVLFCGGMGMRLREHSESIPKPLVQIGTRPIIWHIMKYYAHFGHKDFILCLGHMGAQIKEYFLNYNEYISNNFVMRSGGSELELMSSDIQDWSITFLDTGLKSNIGQRLLRVKEHIGDDPFFLANYTDGLSDVNIELMIQKLTESENTGIFVGVRPNATFHVIENNEDGVVQRINNITNGSFRANGGFFVFRNDIFNYINEGEELIEEPFQRLIEQGKLVTHIHDGFWACMDTLREFNSLKEMESKGDPPWQVWNHKEH
jgi:glucose-1-phosphate cytidylyltransferase